MKNIIEFVKKYKVRILIALLLIITIRSCSKSSQIRKLNKSNIEQTNINDSLQKIVNEQNITIENISEVIRREKIKIHREYDNYISEKDRGGQLMELHRLVKNNIKDLEK
jgi:hypothetical protein